MTSCSITGLWRRPEGKITVELSGSLTSGSPSSTMRGCLLRQRCISCLWLLPQLLYSRARPLASFSNQRHSVELNGPLMHPRPRGLASPLHFQAADTEPLSCMRAYWMRSKPCTLNYTHDDCFRCVHHRF